MASKGHNERRALAEELLGIYRRRNEDFSRIEDIKRGLREIATSAGENFKEEFAGKGVVKVAGGKLGQFKGLMPEVDAVAYLALTEKRRLKLTEDGIIKMAEQHGKPFYGSVSVDVFA